MVKQDDHIPAVMALLLEHSAPSDKALQIIDQFKKDLKKILKEALVFEDALIMLQQIPGLNSRLKEFEKLLYKNLKFDHKADTFMESALETLTERQNLPPPPNLKAYIEITPQDIALMLLGADIELNIVSEATHLNLQEIEQLHNESHALKALHQGSPADIVSTIFNIDLPRIEELHEELKLSLL